MGYGEVQVNDGFWNWSGGSSSWSNLAQIFGNDGELANHERFMLATIEKREDIYQALREFLPNVDEAKNG